MKREILKNLISAIGILIFEDPWVYYDYINYRLLSDFIRSYSPDTELRANVHLIDLFKALYTLNLSENILSPRYDHKHARDFANQWHHVLGEADE